jgi:hypothetical protein
MAMAHTVSLGFFVIIAVFMITPNFVWLRFSPPKAAEVLGNERSSTGYRVCSTEDISDIELEDEASQKARKKSIAHDVR